MTENDSSMTENDTITSDKPSDKHILTLNFTRKGAQKSVHLKKGHAVAICLAAALVLGGSAFSLNSYFSAKNQALAYKQELQTVERSKNQLEQNAKVLETENSEYTANIQELQNKATELEGKINELETVKNELNSQLDNISSHDSSSSEVYDAVAGCLVTPVETDTTFTTIVAPSYNKVAALSVQLNRMDEQLSETGVSFTSVATNVTQTLSAFTDIPSGMPVDGILTTQFNPTGDFAISDGRMHKGIDLSTRSQIVPIAATAAGTVVEADFHGGYGNYVLVDHGNGFTTLYAHNSENLVSVGQKVKMGDIVAMTGSTGQSTGVHCHYEIQLNGLYQNPLDYQ